MSLFGSLSAGVSGLSAQGEAISVISDNLANVNTLGYKGNRALFSQLVTSSGLAGVAYNAGGVGTDVQRSQSIQGTLKSTDSALDLALSGTGFFVVVGDRTLNNDTPYFYTRAGAFKEDSRGFVQHPSGSYLLGWRTESDGTIIDIQNPEPVEVQTVGSSARPTSELLLGLNLTSTEEIHPYNTNIGGANDQDAIRGNLASVVTTPTTSDFVGDARFFDSQGAPRDVSIAYTKRADNLWDWVMYTDGANVVNGTPGTNSAIGYGTLRFNSNGALQETIVRDMTGAVAAGEVLTVNWSGGVSPGQIRLDFGDYTGGVLFSAADLEAANVGFQDDIMDVSINAAEAATAGVNAALPFQIRINAGGQMFIRNDPAGTPVDSGPVAIPSPITEPVTLEFDNGVSVTLSPNFVAPAGPVQVGSNFNTTTVAATGNGVGTNGVLQFASPYNTLFTTQDGFGSGTLASLSVTEDGFVTGSFTNGESKKLFKLVIGVFQDPNRLDAVSANLFRETDASGRPLFKQAGIGGTANVASGSLEQSTVDIANEFSNMIVSQRAFQASSKIVSTVDQMLNELLQLR
jgi:flagellar hook protein FlgE